MFKMTSTAKRGVFEDDFNEDLFLQVIKNISKDAEYVGHEQVDLGSKDGVMSDLVTNDDTEKPIVGLRAFKIRYRHGDEASEHDKTVVFKIKTNSNNVIGLLMHVIGQMIEISTIKEIMAKTVPQYIKHSERREIAFYKTSNPICKAFHPEILMTRADTDRDVYLIAMENLQTDDFTHLNTTFDPTKWSEKERQIALEELARFHSVYYGNTEAIPDELRKLIEESNVFNPLADMKDREGLRVLVEHFYENRAERFDSEMSNILQKSWEKMDDVCAIIGGSPLTLTHGDFGPQNMCLRKAPKPDESRLCVYDWETIKITPPQTDVVYFICKMLPANSPAEKWYEYLEIYRVSLLDELQKREANEDVIQSVSDKGRFKAVFDMCMFNRLWYRLGLFIRYPQILPAAVPRQHEIDNVSTFVKGFASEYAFLKD